LQQSSKGQRPESPHETELSSIAIRFEVDIPRRVTNPQGDLLMSRSDPKETPASAAVTRFALFSWQRTRGTQVAGRYRRVGLGRSRCRHHRISKLVLVVIIIVIFDPLPRSRSLARSLPQSCCLFVLHHVEPILMSRSGRSRCSRLYIYLPDIRYLSFRPPYPSRICLSTLPNLKP